MVVSNLQTFHLISVYVSIYKSIYLSIYLSLSICLSIYLSIYLFIYVVESSIVELTLLSISLVQSDVWG